MRKGFFGLALSVMLFALCLPVEAQQPKKLPRIGYLVTAGDPGNRVFPTKPSDKGCAISVMLRGKIS